MRGWWQRLAARPDIVFVLLIIAFARLVPHPWNLTPIGATALFAGAYMGWRTGWIAPLIPLAIADLFLGGYDPLVMLAVYAGFGSMALIGYGLLGRKRSPLRLVGAVGAGSLWFFALSNFAVWLVGDYPMTAAGLVTCYVKALPFLGNSLLGNSLYAIVFFGGYAVLARRLKGREPALA